MMFLPAAGRSPVWAGQALSFRLFAVLVHKVCLTDPLAVHVGTIAVTAATVRTLEQLLGGVEALKTLLGVGVGEVSGEQDCGDPPTWYNVFLHRDGRRCVCYVTLQLAVLEIKIVVVSQKCL